MAGPRTRVLIVGDHLGFGDQIHGAARLYRLWALHLDPERYEVTVCILRERDALAAAFEAEGIEVVCLGKKKFDPTTLFALVRLVRDRQIDLMHLQAYGATTFGRLAGILTGVPAVVHFHDTNRYYPLLQRLGDRLLAPFTGSYLAVSTSVRDFWALRCHLDPADILVLANCVSLTEFQPAGPEQMEAGKQRLGIEAACKVVGTVTRLFEIKGTRYLLEAAPAVLAHFPESHFVIVGDGPLRQELEALALQQGVQDQVHFVGYVDDVASVLAIVDIKVLTSTDEGGSPLPVLEAMAMGKAIIATTLVEVLEDGVTGILIPPREPQQLAEQIVRLLENPAKARELGDNARKAVERFSVERYMKALDQVYEATIRAHRPPASRLRHALGQVVSLAVGSKQL